MTAIKQVPQGEVVVKVGYSIPPSVCQPHGLKNPCCLIPECGEKLPSAAWIG